MTSSRAAAAVPAAPAAIWRIGSGRTLTLDAPRLIGVVNVTPDSFSDGGAWANPIDAARHGLGLLEQGACMLDVGGESTRPGAQPVGDAEQIARTRPVIERLRGETDAPISIDTTRRAVAESALDAGADVINDVSAGTDDPALLSLAAARGCGIILMHRLRPPSADCFSDRYGDGPPRYADVVAEVREYLLDRAAAAEAAGVAPGSIAIDPGLGFGKTVEQNYRLIAAGAEFVASGLPVVSAASRKSFISAASGVARPSDRDAASTAVSVAHSLAGVRLFRVHDVALHRAALAVAAAIGAAAAAAGGRR